MKARIKATGNIVDVEWYGHNSMGTIYADVTLTTKYYEYELDFNTVYDYWTRLEHQYAGMAMQGLMTILPNIGGLEGRTPKDEIVDIAIETAHALVEKMKEKEAK
jgi:hypothetical protein